MYYPNSNDWWLDPSSGRFDIRANGGSPLATMNILGNLGIGTTGPGARLEVKAAGTTSQLLLSLLRSDASSAALLSTDSNGHTSLALNLLSGATKILLGTSGDSYFLNSGFVGIGTTAPGNLLTLRAAGGAQLRLEDSSPGRTFLFGSGLGAANRFAIQDQTAGSADRLVIDSAGNVAFPTVYGKISFDSTLRYIQGTRSGADYLTIAEHSFAPGIQLGFSDATNPGGGYPFNPIVTIVGNGSTGATGNVGIGTTSPGQALDVNGGAQIGPAGNKAVFSAANGGLTFPAAYQPQNAQDAATRGYVLAQSGGGGGSVPTFVVFKTAGTATWTVPVGVTRVLVEMCGGGGGGGGAAGSSGSIGKDGAYACAGGGGSGSMTSCGGGSGGGAGGGGGAYSKGPISVTGGTDFTINIGDGGAGVSGGAGNSGQATSIVFNSTTLMSAGGGGGGGAYSGGAAGAGGTAGTTTAIAFPGQTGSRGQSVSPYDGGAGGGAFLNYYASANNGGPGIASCAVYTSGGKGAPGLVIISY